MDRPLPVCEGRSSRPRTIWRLPYGGTIEAWEVGADDFVNNEMRKVLVSQPEERDATLKPAVGQ